MATQLPTNREMKDERMPPQPNRYVTGLFLILLGAFLLVGQITGWEMTPVLVLGGLAAIFLAWGLVTRTFGLIIPGGILAGIGLGVYLAQNPFADLSGQETGSLFLLAFSGGWLLIALLSPLTNAGFQWWPLIPGGIIAAVGIALMAGFDPAILAYLSYLGPLALVVLGIWVVLRRG